jgi:hypothetical protein
VFGSVFDKATGFLDKRFALNLLLPSLAFWGGIVLLAVQGAGWASAVERWAHLSGLEQVLVTGAAVAVLMLFAFVVGGQVTALTRQWEGYWPRWLGPLTNRGKARESARWDKTVHGDNGYMRRFFQFPVRKEDVLPTRLGNALRAAEDYSGDDERYGVDAVFFWPRLYLILPADARTQVDEGRSAMDRMVLLASLAVAFPVAALGTIALAGTAWRAWLLASIVAVAVAVLGYRAAVAAAMAFGDLVRSCFDLYRRALLTQLGLTLPATLPAERELWRALQQQLYRRTSEHPELIKFNVEAEDDK